jgi:hypothetical protein
MIAFTAVQTNVCTIVNVKENQNTRVGKMYAKHKHTVFCSGRRYSTMYLTPHAVSDGYIYTCHTCFNYCNPTLAISGTWCQYPVATISTARETKFEKRLNEKLAGMGSCVSCYLQLWSQISCNRSAILASPLALPCWKPSCDVQKRRESNRWRRGVECFIHTRTNSSISDSTYGTINVCPFLEHYIMLCREF